MSNFSFDWADLAFGSKKSINNLDATFIAAPRQLSPERFKELVKAYLPKGNIILGLAKELYVEGFEGQPQFVMLTYAEVADIIEKVNQKSPHKIYTLSYFQRETPVLYDKLRFREVALVNGSWHRSFHLRTEYHALMLRRIPYTMVSPFTDEKEAKTYEECLRPLIAYRLPNTLKDEDDVFDEVRRAAKASFDTSFQVGAVLAQHKGQRYRLKLAAHNTVVPFETFALHYGASRERHSSPPGDQNYYDSVHAEMMLLIESAKAGLSLKGLSLFVNVLPCPACARALSKTDIADIVYLLDHSEGYAVSLLEVSGKTVRHKIGKEIMLQ